MSAPLNTYLKTHRLRTGLTEEDVAFLIGAASGVIVSRHEQLGRQPNLLTVLAYAVIYRAPVTELFAGLCQKVERETLARARLLIEKLNAVKLDRIAAHKLAILRSLAEGPVPADSASQR